MMSCSFRRVTGAKASTFPLKPFESSKRGKSHDKLKSEKFNWICTRQIIFCLNIGAPGSAVGDKELKRILSHLCRLKLEVKYFSNAFKFADAVFSYYVITKLPLATPPIISSINNNLAVISTDVTELLGLPAMRQNALLTYSIASTLEECVKFSNFQTKTKDTCHIRIKQTKC